MISRSISLLSTLIISALSVAAQVPITMKGHWISVGSSFSYEGRTFPVNAMIDTGFTYCAIDSTFAADSCGIIIDNEKEVYNTDLQNKVRYITLSSLQLSGKSYEKLYCFILDFRGKFKEYAPKFIIGANALKQELWEFDLKNFMLSPQATSTNSKPIYIPWKNYNKKNSPFLDAILISAIIDKKKGLYLFDLGSRFNKVSTQNGFIPTEYKLIEMASLSKALSLQETGFLEDEVDVSGIKYKTKLAVTDENIGTLNADFLQGVRFVLNYKKKRLEVYQ